MPNLRETDRKRHEAAGRCLTVKYQGRQRASSTGQEEPGTEYIEEESQVRVVVHLPDVSETKIRIELDNDVLVISATNGGKKYCKEIMLPWTARVVSRKFRNGILELTLERTQSAPQ
ncbi:MAG: Hsp20/alpha crystallin family protein [Methanomicrobiales archaeon]|nr:Hsp20/alpha crystallin family protein [Methanomicrobiales archaeon]